MSILSCTERHRRDPRLAYGGAAFQRRNHRKPSPPNSERRRRDTLPRGKSKNVVLTSSNPALRKNGEGQGTLDLVRLRKIKNKFSKSRAGAPGKRLELQACSTKTSSDVSYDRGFSSEYEWIWSSINSPRPRSEYA